MAFFTWFLCQVLRPRRVRPTWQWGLLFLLAGATLVVLWLESLNRYFMARYQVALDSHIPAAWFVPAAQLGRALNSLTDEEASLNNTGAPANGEPNDPPSPQGIAPFSAQDVPLPDQGYWPDVRQQKMPQLQTQRVVFVGDSMMQGVAPWVIRSLGRAQPEWQTEDLSRQSTGLTARRYFDWPARIAKEVADNKTTAVVLFLGPNDPQDIVDAQGQRHVFPSAGWQTTYAARVDEVLQLAKQHSTYVLWVGLPAMREPRLQRGAQVLNRIFHDRAMAHGTDYLSLEPLLGVANRPYQHTILDAQNRVLTVRASDGTHFTPAGQQRIEHAVLLRLQEAAQP
jgi:uncharacterized protein